ncbi:SpoIIE family protein phosphatase [Kineococcus sp. R8]|uniref:GAF domain-containing SpoIIE family protein phosphatase n=1 Tax=Kineococcus siccus TaxID=2696567 RepID=UPI001411F3CA|nr:GAF domain-containing SpoIIE family protein phosphatase [Kineococcus siccus]NAZ82469.1 SpoIIE family protein phosphatase [Kineococcus siccus]
MDSPGAVDPSLLLVWEEVADGVVVLDHRDWRVVHVNAAGAVLFGRPAAAVLGRPLGEVFPAAVGSPFHESLRRARDEGGVVSWTGPFPGSALRVEVRVLSTGTQVLCAFRDVTAAHVLEQERDELLTSVRQSLQHTRDLLQLSEALSATSTVDDIAAVVVKVGGASFGAHHATLTVVDHERRLLRTPHLAEVGEAAVRDWGDMPLDGPGPGTEVVRTGAALFLGEAQLRERYPELAPRWERVRSTAVLPLHVLGRVEGLLVLVWSTDHASGSTEQVLLRAFASYAGQALQRASLLAERTATARTLQQSLLTSELPQPAGYELRALYEAAGGLEQVGGDWFDGVVLPGGATMLVIGDVTGHDIAAAAAMGQLRIALRSLAVDRDDAPSQLLARLESVLVSLGGEPLMASCVVGRLEGRTFRWTNAGHPPPLLVLPGGRVRRLDSPPELLLGVRPDARRSDHVVDLPEGAVLLLYTDGLVELRGSDLDAGIDRLGAAAAGLAAGDLAAGLRDVLTTALGGVPGGDDTAVLAARVLPHA